MAAKPPVWQQWMALNQEVAKPPKWREPIRGLGTTPTSGTSGRG